MEHFKTYQPETATQFFDELTAALGHRPDYRRVYGMLSQVFHRSLAVLTQTTQINFGGDFAKTDYLLRQAEAPRRLVKDVNDTRVRLRRRHELSDDDLQRFCLYDVKALCQFLAAVYHTDIPGHLLTLLPTEKVPSPPHTPAPPYLRCIVERWDADYLYVLTEQTTDGEARRVALNPSTYDRTYLRGLLREGAQLNLIRPREDNGILYPELFIYEPDYLVNVSTIAHCFTNYADSPLVDLIKRLEPQQSSEAIVLGNLAGQLLDEAIHQEHADRPYADTVKDFFRDHAVSLLTAGVGPDFHAEAMRQQRHIRQAVSVTLPQRVAHFSAADGIVEPSFFSEMLGLQGRLDYLQQDFRLLMEQKSGKGAFPYDNFTIPRHTEEHYVQMLLYMALIRYNYSEAYNRNHGVQAFLLYSKYSESLLALGFAPDLLFNALRVRNQLTWLDLQLARPDGYSLLERLTPEALNKRHVSNTLWQNWQRPQIAAVLNAVKQASPLERAYYERFLSFIAREHVLAKLGNKTKDSSGFAATWHDSLEEKLQAGNIYDRLQLVSTGEGERVSHVVLRFSETADNDLSNFRVGDIVILYPYDPDREPDVRRTMVFRATIEQIGTSTIRLRLRATQTDDRIFRAHSHRLWAIEHDFMESSFSSLYRGMQAFLGAPLERRQLLLLQREPETDATRTLKGDYGNFNDLALRVKQARDLFLIIGPPGTGKTSFGMLYTVKEELLEPNATVLLLSYTNRAVDEICSKLHAEGIDFLRIGGTASCAPAYRDHLLNSRIDSSPSVSALKELLLQSRVVVGTTTALTASIALLRLKQFSLAVIDEASQILEPHLIALLSAHNDGRAAISKMVLIGDHKQLPAVVQQTAEESAVSEPLLHSIGLTNCRHSLFERLLRHYAHRPDVSHMLRRQGRMHPDIAHFPNIQFYGGRLQEVPLPHQLVTLPVTIHPSPDAHHQDALTGLLRTRRIAFISPSTLHSQHLTSNPSDKVNLVEADMIAATVTRIFDIEHDNFDPDRTVGVIVPYRNQIAAVRAAIDRYADLLADGEAETAIHSMLHNITIDTVERYQGSQRRYIIYGFTIQKYYQLDFLTSNVFEDPTDGTVVDRKLNVAMTRAEEHLILFGNEQLLSNNLTFYRLMEYARQRGCFLTVSRDDFVSGNFNIG